MTAGTAWVARWHRFISITLTTPTISTDGREGTYAYSSFSTDLWHVTTTGECGSGCGRGHALTVYDLLLVTLLPKRLPVRGGPGIIDLGWDHRNVELFARKTTSVYVYFCATWHRPVEPQPRTTRNIHNTFREHLVRHAIIPKVEIGDLNIFKSASFKSVPPRRWWYGNKFCWFAPWGSHYHKRRKMSGPFKHVSISVFAANDKIGANRDEIPGYVWKPLFP
ncbi:hypothetical protein EDC04DRAFT_2610656 [Pisolithus marmoratus]|nr:hypothetical protein EDC04DRAFT_2610656 [Pisolithus marmoratus]